MISAAVIQFPGSTGIQEVVRSLQLAGFEAEVIRWNELNNKEFDGYILPGGASFGDYIRGGVLAARTLLLQQLKVAAGQGKVIIGFGNGCQILMESGLLPGLPQNVLAGGVAENVRVQHHTILGTGYYHTNSFMQSVAQPGRCAVNVDIPQGTVFNAPLSSSYGRFMISNELLLELEKRDQIIYKYCTNEGRILNEFPTTPNGAMWGIAGFCNPAGNVVGCMTHPTRTESGIVLFEAMRKYLEKKLFTAASYTLQWQPEALVIKSYTPAEQSLQLYIQDTPLDKSSNFMEQTLQQLGFKVTIQHHYHWEIWHSAGQGTAEELAQQIMSTGMMTTTTEQAYSTSFTPAKNSVNILVRPVEDYEGKRRTDIITKQLPEWSIDVMRGGRIWQIEFEDPENMLQQLEQILQTYIVYNPYIEECFIFNVNS